MLRRTRKHRKKLARLVLAALLSTGGVYGLMGPSAAEAAGSITVTGYADGAFISEPSGGMTVVPESGYSYAYPADGSVTVLHIAPGEEDPWNNATDNITVMGRYGTEASGYAASGSTVTMTGPKAKLYNLYGG